MERRLTVSLVVAAAMLLLVGSAQAQVVLSEDFTGTTGDNITTLGWTQTSDTNILISDTLVDVGQSSTQETFGGGETWSHATKDLSAPVTLAGAQEIVLEYVLRSPDSINEENNTWLTLRTWQNSGDPNGRFRVGNGLQFLEIGGGDYIARSRVDHTYDDSSDWVTLPILLGDVVDMKVVGTATDVTGYWRQHGDATWIQYATAAVGSGSAGVLADHPMEYLRLNCGNRGDQQWVDSINVTAVIPEPGSMAALAMGLSGLVGFAIRRRR